MSERSSPVVVVTGANGFVGARVCAALVERGAVVRAVVRRAGSAPTLPGVKEHVGEFHDPDLAAAVVAGADAVVTTVHPLGGDRQSQEQVAVAGTPVLARAARDAGVARLVHVSTAAVYDRSPGRGDVDESAALVDDHANDYAVTKRDTDLALAEIDGITSVLVRPPAILGRGKTSVWNAVVPRDIRDDESERHAVAGATFAWVHVDDLVALMADLAVGRIAVATDPERGPVEGACTAVNVAAQRATRRDYLETVTTALGVEPVWEEDPAWTGQILSDRARAWGWAPTVSLADALAELAEDARALH
jgi:nucleoside-diphosphate-sugar epimerase